MIEFKSFFKSDYSKYIVDRDMGLVFFFLRSGERISSKESFKSYDTSDRMLSLLMNIKCNLQSKYREYRTESHGAVSGDIMEYEGAERSII